MQYNWCSAIPLFLKKQKHQHVKTKIPLYAYTYWYIFVYGHTQKKGGKSPLINHQMVNTSAPEEVRGWESGKLLIIFSFNN